ncbi:TraR/DksA C4-type zinc finger protein [Natronospora cellulosivora (SeqCode)]
MENNKLNYYRNILNKERDRLKKEMKSFEDEQRLSQKDSTGELSSYDNHPGDEGTLTFEREMDLGLFDNIFSRLKEVDDALEKIDTGDYGICQSCGDSINKERLDLVPATSFCQDCKEIEEDKENVRDRPLEEESFYPSFRGFNDETGANSYDAEDTWQDLAQYGTSSGPVFSDDAVTGEKPRKEAYVDTDELIGTVGIEDSIINDEVDNLEEAVKTSTTFTGIKGQTER